MIGDNIIKGLNRKFNCSRGDIASACDRTRLENPNPQIRRGDEQRGAIRQMRRTGFAFGKLCDRRKPSAQTQAIIDYVQQNK